MQDSPGSHQQRDSAEAHVQQARLFEADLVDVAPPRERPPVVRIPVLTTDSPLSASQIPYQHYLRLSNRSKNTIACFLSDLRLFAAFVGSDRPLGSIALEDLDRWRRHLQLDDEVGGLDEMPKTVARRMTFLRNFFGWLAEEGVLAQDPAAELKFRRPLPPLQEVPFEDEVQRLEDAAREEARCYALVMLVLETGLKQEEVLGLRLRDIDLSDPQRPAVQVRFPRKDRRRRERRMTLPAAWTQVYQRYIERYRPVEYVFECTGRNLNYVLTSAVRRAGLKRRITLQILRDVYAIRQLRAGVTPEDVRDKLGLSEEAWQEAGDKYQRLAFSM